MMSRTQVVMLGTGTPNDEAERVSSGIAIVIDDKPYLVDCGHGIVQRVVQAKSMGKITWTTSDLTCLFVTHLHADHIVGLPDLMFTPWIHGRFESIRAYGPHELHTMVDHLYSAFSENIREHTYAHPSTANGYRVEVTSISDGQIYQDENLSVFALPANHGELTAFSFKFVTADKTIVISGDTKPVLGFIEWAKDCDILIHEVYSSLKFKSRPGPWQEYHSRVHTSTDELASLANQIQPKQLLLYHQLFWGQTPLELVEEITKSYNGIVISTNDLDIF